MLYNFREGDFMKRKTSIKMQIILSVFVVVFLLGVILLAISIMNIKKQIDRDIRAEMNQLMGNISS